MCFRPLKMRFKLFPQVRMCSLNTSLKPFLLLLFLAIVNTCAANASSTPDWRPVTEEERAVKTPVVDPDSGAEILFTDVEVDDWDANDRSAGLPLKTFSYEDALTHKTFITTYARIKIYNERGIEQLKSYQSYSYNDKYEHISVAGRVIKPDGTIRVIGDDEIYTRETYRFGDYRRKTKSFSFSGLEPGCIVDIWFHNAHEGWAGDMIYGLGNCLPVQKAHISIRPTNLAPCHVSYDGFQGGLKKNSSGWIEAELHNLPASLDESFLPGEYGVQPWMTVFYDTSRIRTEPKEFWGNLGNRIDKFSDRKIKGSRTAVKQKAKELTQGVTDPNERLRRLYEFCTRNIVNVSSDNSGLSMADLEDVEDNDDVVKTLKSGKGTGFDITILFASLAKASGYDVELALCSDRLYLDWKATLLTNEAVKYLVVAIKDKDKWAFYVPSASFVPFGMLTPGAEGSIALIGSDEKAPLLTRTPFTPSDKSLLLRKGDFTIAEDGTLSGKVEEKYTGQKARELKRNLAEETPQARQDEIRDEIRKRLPTAEVTDIVFTNIEDPDKDVSLVYNVNIPGYADASGKRIFLQPCYFEKGVPPIFTKPTRVWDIRFPYAWETHDTVRITYPENYEIEEGAAPQSLMDCNEFGYKVELGKSKDKPVVVYKRENKINILTIPVKLYGGFKDYTDSIAQQDGHVLTLKRVEKPAEAPVPQSSDKAQTR
jgi:hypothetical protein